MTNPFSKIFPLTISLGKQAVDTPFTALLQTKFADFFGASFRERTLEAYRGWVFACVKAISEDVGDIKIHLMKRTADGEAEEVFDHPVLDLLKKVNPRMTKHDLFEITQAHQELEGNAFWFLARDNAKVIREIWPLRPDRVTLIQDEQNPLMVSQYIYRQRGGQAVKFDANDIIHFSQFNNEGEYPFPVRGLGTVQAASRAIDTNFFASDWNKNFFLNSARPDVILKSNSKLAPAEYERLKRSWDSAFRGTDKAHRPFILTGGLEIDKLTSSQKDMDFVAQLIQSRDEILAVFRVPKTVLGITDDVNRANAEATNFVFAQRTIKPKMQRVADTLTEILLPLFGVEEHWFTFDSPVPEDRDAKVKEWAAGIDKWLTRNDIRTQEGLPPTKEGDSIFQPFSIQAQDSVDESAKAVKKPGPQHPLPAPAAKGKKGKEAKYTVDITKEHINLLFAKNGKTKTKKVKVKTQPKQKVRRELTFDQVEALRPIWIKQIEVNEQLLSKKLRKFFDGQQERVFEALREGLKGLKRKEYRLKQVDDLLPEFRVEVDQVIDLLSPDFLEFLRAGGQLAFDTLAIDETFEVNLESQEFIVDRLKVVGEQINDTTFEKIRPIIEAGIEQNQSIDTISQTLADDVFKEARGFRTDRIARTEVSEAQNFGNLEAMKQAGATRKRWVNFDPPDDHALGCTPDPLEVPIDDSFSNGLQHPPQHPNCVCTTIAIFED